MDLPSYPNQVSQQQAPVQAVPQRNVGGSMQTLSLWQKFWMGIASLFTVLVLLTLIPQYLFRSSALTVVGEGKLSVQPQQVSLIVTRVNTSTDVVSAINEGDAGLKVLIDTAKSLVGNDAEIKKSFYQMRPAAAATGGTSYQVANAFSLKSTKVDNLDEVIKTLYRDGASTVTNVSFSTQNQEATEQEARVLAVKDAREKAAQIARSAGKRLGRLVTIADDNTNGSSSIGSAVEGASSSTLDNIEVTKQVSVTYEIW